MSDISFTNEIAQRQCIIEELQEKIQSIREEIESFLQLETLVKNLLEQSTLVYSTMKKHCPDKLSTVGITLCQNWEIDREQLNPTPHTDAKEVVEREKDSNLGEGENDSQTPDPFHQNDSSASTETSDFAVGDTVRYRGEGYTIQSVSVKEKVARISNDNKTKSAFFSLLEKIADADISDVLPQEVTVKNTVDETPTIPENQHSSKESEKPEELPPTPFDNAPSKKPDDPPFEPGDAVIIRSNYLNGRYRGKRGTIVNYIGLGAAFVDVGDSKPLRLNCKYLERVDEASTSSA